jgi:DNA-binding transcriptional MerR regulator
MSDDLTIDQLAARVGMTVRNVRAYSSRGLIPPPRLVGRTGYYGEHHVRRLHLVRDLIERGYTLSAVERAMADNFVTPDAHVLDLISVLSDPLGEAQEPELMHLDALGHLANIEVDREHGLLDLLQDRGLLERVDDDTVRLLKPALVRAGAQAMALGVSREVIARLLDEILEGTDLLAAHFVGAARDDVWRPFRDAGMPEERWPEILHAFQALLPIASQVVVAAFRDRLAHAIEQTLGEELEALGDAAPGMPFGGGVSAEG